MCYVHVVSTVDLKHHDFARGQIPLAIQESRSTQLISPTGLALRRHQTVSTTDGGDIKFTERVGSACNVGQCDAKVRLMACAPDIAQRVFELGGRT